MTLLGGNRILTSHIFFPLRTQRHNPILSWCLVWCREEPEPSTPSVLGRVLAVCVLALTGCMRPSLKSSVASSNKMPFLHPACWWSGPVHLLGVTGGHLVLGPRLGSGPRSPEHGLALEEAPEH